jgi:3-deoxy-D-manno-octulosonic-acid transferase
MGNMIYFLYNFLWTISSLFLIPFTSSKKWMRPMKFGLDLSSSPKVNGENIWIHALSVGEVISSKPIIRGLRERYPSKKIVLTVKTAQGIKVAAEELSPDVDWLCFMPLDFWWSIGRLVHAIRPSLMILVETDIWPGLISCLKKKGIKIILVNGRISPNTFKNYKRFSFITRRILSDIELFLMQSELDRKRLLDTGLSPDKVIAIGNIKFDSEWSPMDEDERNYWLSLLNLSTDSRVIVAGSTHEGEEGIILGVFKKIIERFPDIKLIIAPRKPERAEAILRLSLEMGMNSALRTDPDLTSKPAYDVLILDSLGELGRLYGIAEISFVGGSMVPVGGHNLLEPAVFGRPVLFGVHTHNFVLMAQLLLRAGGGMRIKDTEDLFIKIKGLLSNPLEAEEMGKRASQFVKDNNGALERAMDYLGGYIE